MTRKEVQTFTKPNSAAYFEIDTVVELWATNSTLEKKSVKLDVKSFDLAGGLVYVMPVRDVDLDPNAATEIWKGSLVEFGQPKRTKKSDPVRTLIISARILDSDGTVLARYANWCVNDRALCDCIEIDRRNRPEPFKYIHFPDPGLKIAVAGDEVTLSSEKPIKGIVLDVAESPDEEPKWSDQAIDLVPGDPQVVVAAGLNGRSVKARYLGDGTA